MRVKSRFFSRRFIVWGEPIDFVIRVGNTMRVDAADYARFSRAAPRWTEFWLKPNYISGHNDRILYGMANPGVHHVYFNVPAFKSDRDLTQLTVAHEIAHVMANRLYGNLDLNTEEFANMFATTSLIISELTDFICDLEKMEG